MNHLFRQFSFPGGIPSHVAPELPGSIHEGGELGYPLSHAYGAVLDNPGLIVACVIGDGEGTTTTPFDMVVRNDLDRFHLATDVIDRVPGLAQRAVGFRQWLIDQRTRHHAYILEHGDDLPEVRDWHWPAQEGTPS